MRRYVLAFSSLMTALALVTMVGCEQEDPVEKAGQEIMKSTQDALDKVRGVGGTLEKAGENTAEQVKEATE